MIDPEGAVTEVEVLSGKCCRTGGASFAMGTGLGLGVSLLVAPASGAETRRKIFRRAERIGSTVRERFSLGAKKPSADARASAGGVREAANE